MNRVVRTHKLKLRRETVRRLTRTLTEQHLAKVLGGSEGDGGPALVSIPTSCTEPVG